jgi:hypothetical protein
VPSMAFALHERLGSLWVPIGLTSRRCRICVMLRAAVLHPFLRGIRRFRTSSPPEALGACYVASWQLPRPDLHRSADDDFSGDTRQLLGGRSQRSYYPAFFTVSSVEVIKYASPRSGCGLRPRSDCPVKVILLVLVNIWQVILGNELVYRLDSSR